MAAVANLIQYMECGLFILGGGVMGIRLARASRQYQGHEFHETVCNLPQVMADGNQNCISNSNSLTGRAQINSWT